MDQESKNLLMAAKQNNILDDSEVQKLVLAAGLSSNESLQRPASEAILGKSIQHWRYPFDSQNWFGELELGHTFDDQSVFLSQNDLAKHLLAVGQSGSGKTTLFYSLMSEVDEPFWAFDLKRDYRHLASETELLVLPWQEFRFNPLRPPEGVSSRRWAQVFCEVFGHATSLLSGSKNYLLKKVLKLYKLYGLLDEVSGPFPSLVELQLLVKNDSVNYMRKASDYRETVLNRLEAVNLTSDRVFACSEGFRPEDLLKRDVVFEFDGLGRDVQDFVMEVLLAYVYEYRVAQNDRGQGLNHLFFLDEGKRVFSVYKERQEASGVPEVDELTAKMREFGEGLVVADQEASKLTDSIKANTYTKVLLATGDRKQREAVTEAMNLSERQEEFASDLEVGEAIVQQGGREPAVVKLSDYELEKSLSDRRLREMMEEKWAMLNYTERSLSDPFKDEMRPGDSDKTPDSDDTDRDGGLDLSAQADRFLRDVAENPFKPLTKRYEEFSSRYKGNKAKNEAVDEGILIERQVQENQGSKKLLQFTDKGRRYLSNKLDLQVKREGRGSIRHLYWQHEIRDAFDEKGWNTTMEKDGADVHASKGSETVVVEIAMGNNPREIQHVEKHVTEASMIWIAAKNREILEGLKQRAEEQGLNSDNVGFRLVRKIRETIESLG